MSKSYRVTIVPEAEDRSAPPNAMIEKTVANLTPLTKVLRASHMEGVADCLDEAWANPERGGRKIDLQIVGHGTSGLLHLGSFWMAQDDVLPPRVFADPFYILDTNPWSLSFLAEHRNHFDRVSLVACRIGASDSEGYTINGRTLAYTLCELLQTTVLAAMDFTDPCEHDEYGDYRPLNHLLPSRWEWRSSGEPAYTNPNRSSEPNLNRTAAEPLTFRVVGLRPRVPVPARTPLITTDLELHVTPLDDPRLLNAAPELLASVHGHAEPAHIFGNGRVLRIGAELFAIERDREVSQQLAAQLM